MVTPEMTPQDRSYETIKVTVENGVATLILNRPERRNALGAQMVGELMVALENALSAELVRSIVLTGAGKTFSAGGDFSQLSGESASHALPVKGDYKDLLLLIVQSTKPVVARVNGHAMGGGLGLVAAATYAVAAADAKLGTPEIDVGLFPFMIMAVLDRVMPRRRLIEMMLTGERLEAEEALRLGLVNKVVPSGELDAAVHAYTTIIASKSASTVRLGLEALRDAEPFGLEDKLCMLSGRLQQCLATDDAREGLTAFLEKRQPRWTGK